MFCSSKTTQSICTCINGKDTCSDYGSCAPTPCKQCGDCVAQLQNFAAAQAAAPSATAAQVADGFSVFCSGNLVSLGTTAATCSAVTESIKKTANIGRRAGTMCSLLGKQLPIIVFVVLQHLQIYMAMSVSV